MVDTSLIVYQIYFIYWSTVISFWLGSAMLLVCLLLLPVILGNTIHLHANEDAGSLDGAANENTTLSRGTTNETAIRAANGRSRVKRESDENTPPEPGTLGNTGVCTCAALFAVITINNQCKVRLFSMISLHVYLKVPKCEIFDLLYFVFVHQLDSIMGRRRGDYILKHYFLIFRGSYAPLIFKAKFCLSKVKTNLCSLTYLLVLFSFLAFLRHFKGSDQWKMRGVKKLANVQRLYRTVAIDVSLFFYEAVIFSWTYFRFLFVKLNL
jgi:hypothetical protein